MSESSVLVLSCALLAALSVGNLQHQSAVTADPVPEPPAPDRISESLNLPMKARLGRALGAAHVRCDGTSEDLVTDPSNEGRTRPWILR